jgi:predicted Zn finger-like uncharacterized protein
MPSLAARCTACGTVFRVVQDQLRVAGGLVRCGRCGEVFNAAQGLIDLDTPAAAAPPSVAEPDVAAAPAGQESTEAAFDVGLQTTAAADGPPAAALPQPGAAAPARADDADVPAEPALDFAAVDPAPQRAAVAEVLLHGTPAATDATEVPPSVAPADPRAEPDEMPSFVRDADRAQRWRQPRVRAALAAMAALGALALAAQIAHGFRDQIAARFPAAQPVLEAGCRALGCRVEALRAIDKLAVESSGLVRVEKSRVYKLQVTLRNRGSTALALPAMDLTLSDSAGKPVARRVLRAAELGVNTDTLAAGRELALQATLQAATEPIVGYTVELFYP